MHQFPIHPPEFEPTQMVNYHNQMKVAVQTLKHDDMESILFHWCIQDFLKTRINNIQSIIKHQRFDLLDRYKIEDVEEFVSELQDHHDGRFVLRYNDVEELIEAMFHKEMDEINNLIQSAIPTQSDIFEESK